MRAIRSSLSARLRERRGEIEAAILDRVEAVDADGKPVDSIYREGQRQAIPAALDYGLNSIEHGEKHPLSIPTPLLGQARLAARTGISLDTVLRRYVAGNAVLDDCLVEEVGKADLNGASLQRLRRRQTVVFESLLAAVSDEHRRESKSLQWGADGRRAERIRRLLDGEHVDTSDLTYDFDALHVGLVAAGDGVIEAIKALAKKLDRRLLLLPRGDHEAWAWLGGRQMTDDTIEVIRGHWPTGLDLAVGEFGRGLNGWKITHRQAKAAHPVGMRRAQDVVRYSEVPILSAVMHDDLLARSLRSFYLAPLEGSRRGQVLRRTLETYLRTGRNGSSTAAALGVSPRTISNRLRMIESRIGTPITAAATDIDIALRLQELDAIPQA